MSHFEQTQLNHTPLKNCYLNKTNFKSYSLIDYLIICIEAELESSVKIFDILNRANGIHKGPVLESNELFECEMNEQWFSIPSEARIVEGFFAYRCLSLALR